MEGGEFMMGYAPNRDEEVVGNWIKERATPLHKVSLPPFCVAETQVTQALWEAVMGKNPSRFKGAERPVENVSWDDCKEFIEKLNALTGKNFQLPREAQWEYAARGGNKSHDYIYAGSNDIAEVAWYWKNSGGETHAVAQKQPNELGLYDMSGNVREWCEDDWHSNYQGAPKDGSAWIDNPRAAHRIVRGNSWGGSAADCRIAYRSYSNYGNSIRLFLSNITNCNNNNELFPIY